MRLAFAALALAALLPAGPALAHDAHGVRLNRFDCDDPLRWAARHDASRARHAITTEDGKVTLVLTDRVVALQLSDRTMRKLDRELRRERREDDDGPLGEAIKAAVLGTVRSALDHSAECPLRELRDVRYEDGRLVFVTHDGERLFERIEVDDESVLEAFDPGDAREFVREFHRVRASRG
jgi:hypothetical protein